VLHLNNNFDLNLRNIPPEHVQYANGTVITSSTGASIGPSFPSLILPNQIDSLISINTALDAGGTLVLQSSGGALTNADSTSTLPISRVGAQWRAKLRDCYHDDPGPANSDDLRVEFDSTQLPTYLQTICPKDVVTI